MERRRFVYVPGAICYQKQKGNGTRHMLTFQISEEKEWPSCLAQGIYVSVHLIKQAGHPVWQLLLVKSLLKCSEWRRWQELCEAGARLTLWSQRAAPWSGSWLGLWWWCHTLGVLVLVQASLQDGVVSHVEEADQSMPTLVVKPHLEWTERQLP